ncbi:phosphoenolpyruvate--protein phosphotransferase [Akkermansiaceae bacterium]|nr:phosphoenolpyruvate--protein phosphotransferase [Akkermansiaceae bacterium]MDB4416857.1 phosphoenolpyruvate--protein phosphotransferase [bacterium]MDA7935720.1 phosphoenolpyruvate--protein phosphotransferase [Akkermansiaceae bacterium]MDB0067810.1 phosphoenolpyruvate--protein phosphotransferase [Akkermansiaceae bacterium]MDB4313587.1 phosphoenolpyruvate--protein phosphotransferase [Akkermansiaceae bacterium]
MKSNPQPEQVFHGIPVSRGIAMGPISVMARGFSAPGVYPIAPGAVVSEQGRFDTAVRVTKEQLAVLQEKIESVSGRKEGLVFEAHSMVLDDSSLLKRVYSEIDSRLQNAEFCFYAVMQTFLEAMRRVSDPYLRERTVDIEDVCQRVLRNFSGDPGIVEPSYQRILVAYDLSPSDTASFDREKLLGFVTEAGSVNSHTAILARALGIPSIVGLAGVVLNSTTLAPAILDGYSGKFILYPSEETTAHYQALAEKRAKARRSLEELRDEESTTLDGRHITLSANIEFTHELGLVRDNRAEGVGLFRTEFFLLESSTSEMPNEEAQEKIYREIARGVSPHQGIIRTLDSGGDKLSTEPFTEPEPNPFLGWRGIRVSLDRQEIFKEQLRAILRASAHGKLGVMFPFISGVTEMRECRRLMRECMEELDAGGVAYDPKLEIGAMIEIPSAAIMANELAKEVDFFSIGTNDLIQYTVAVDRINHRVAKLYRSSHPAVIRLIKMTTEAADTAGIWTGICGEMAADLSLTPLLVGLGVNELSVGPHDLAPVRKALISLNYSDCQKLAVEALEMATSREIYELSQKAAREAYPDLFEEIDPA